MTMIHDITAKAPRNKRPTRKGRGKAAGKGKTAGRGTKGSFARVGTTFKQGHEHGQTPLYRRVPKRGFSNAQFERRFHVVNLSDLERFDEGTTVDQAALIEAGLVPDDRLPLKVLGDGEIGKKLTVVAEWYSKSAQQKITAAGGAAQNPKGEAFKFPKPLPKFDHSKDAGKRKQPAAAAAAPEGAPAESAAPAAAAPADAAPAEGGEPAKE
jgi:large subunit ribosomal protein L15